MMELTPQNDWVAARDDLISKAKAVTVVDSESTLEVVGSLDTQAKKLINKLSAQRKEITSKLDAAKKSIMASEKSFVADLVSEQERLNKLCVAYATEVERKRQEELAAIQRMEAEMATAALIAEQSDKNYDPFKDDNSPYADVQVQAVPSIESPKTSANTFVKVYKFEIVDANKIPRELCVPDEKKIRAMLNYQKQLGNDPESMVIPGLRIYSEMSVRSRN